jgi:hypothetical protein
MTNPYNDIPTNEQGEPTMTPEEWEIQKKLEKKNAILDAIDAQNDTETENQDQDIENDNSMGQ